MSNDDIEADDRAARAMGLSYGKYKALFYDPTKPQQKTSAPQKPNHRPKRRYTDEEAFALWQEGLSDSEIGERLGVSRTIIQRWRDILELPSTKISKIDTKKYRLSKTNDGIYYIIHE